jgi:transglutaminase-like putative cysteine protease
VAATTHREDLLMLATLAVLVTACLPLARVYIGLAFLRPVLGAVLLSLGLAWGARRLGAGPIGSLLVTLAGWVAFVSAAFFGETLVAGVIPTGSTVGAGVQLWLRGLELMRLRPSPAFAEAGLMFITVSGVWAVSHAVEGLVMRLAAPLRAIGMAMLLWTVPLAVAPPSGRSWAWAAPFLAAAALLMLAFAGADLRRWGVWSPARRRGRPVAAEPSLLPTGSALALAAIIAGSILAGALPGYGEAPWYQVRGIGGTTLTTNPIVDIRSRLVAQDSGPVLQVVTDRPVYLRTTSLDVYSAAEEWTNAGIRGAPVRDSFPLEVPLGPVERVRLEVEVRNLPEAVLVPAPYQALAAAGPLADVFQYDQGNSTITLDAGVTLETDDRYGLVAAIPAPTADQLEAAGVVRDHPAYTRLPDNVPQEVRDLARQIVEDADATSAFEQALALQNELRSWEYSIEPPQGHGGQAMSAFITNRVGYCEQYAGTMAVMLRSLGLPARVAVGYTPGQLVDPDNNTYVISNANAHAWVEVLFDGLGWIAFEPTPRSDGNVLVPTAANIAPARTAAETGGAPEQIEDFANSPRDVPNPERGGNIDEQPTELAAPGGGAGGGGGGRGLATWGLIAFALLAAAGTAIVLLARREQDYSARPAVERVLRARAAAEQVGRGLGLVPAPWETDHEYLGRMAHRHGLDARSAAGTLAVQAARARYAPTLTEQSAVVAEKSSTALAREMLKDRSAWQRTRIEVRGWLSTAATRLLRRR